MATTNNYLIQARQAKDLFLTYDQDALIQKFQLKADETYFYLPMLHDLHRLHRKTGELERLTQGSWVDANSFGEVMTLLDFLCGSRDDRFLSSRLKNMTSFGLMFHQNLLEDKEDPWANRFQKEADGFRRACQALGGVPFPRGDVAYTLDYFPELPVTIQLWFGDEEFPPNLRLLWDENTTMYIRYETMHYARGLLLKRISEEMDRLNA